MICELLTFTVSFAAIMMVAVVLIQQGKGDLGLSGGQALFGGTGGQSFLEKITWFLAMIFIFGCLGLSVIKSKQKASGSSLSSYQKKASTAPISEDE